MVPEIVENLNKSVGTLRHRTQKPKVYNPELSINRDWKYIGDRNHDTSKSVAVTFIDRKYNFVSESSSDLISESIPMRTEEMGKDLLDDLAPYFCYTKHRYDYGLERIHTFKVPVEDYIIIVDRNNKYSKKNNMIEWKGKYYDPEKIYLIKDNFNQQDGKYKMKSSMVEFCSKYIQHPFPKDGKITNIGSCKIDYYIRRYPFGNHNEQDIGVMCGDCSNNESHFITMINRDYKYYRYNEYNERITNENEVSIATQTNYVNRFNMTKDEEKRIKQQEIILDTKTIKCITHIGILPEPVIAGEFPLFENEKHRASIDYVVNTNQHARVDNFKIWHKLKKSDKWSYLGQYGCLNNYNEINLIELITSEFNSNEGLKFRYLKIIIGSFHIAPIMRLEFYGKLDEKIFEKKAKIYGDKNFVEYTVSVLSENNLHDKYMTHYNKSSNINHESRTAKKNNFKFNLKIDN